MTIFVLILVAALGLVFFANLYFKKTSNLDKDKDEDDQDTSLSETKYDMPYQGTSSSKRISNSLSSESSYSIQSIYSNNNDGASGCGGDSSSSCID